MSAPRPQTASNFRQLADVPPALIWFDSIKRPKIDSHEGKTPAIGDAQARVLLTAPDDLTLTGCGSCNAGPLLYCGLRCTELRALRLVDL